MKEIAVTPEFESECPEMGGLTLCPDCGGNNLHHGKVEVFTRDAEDSDVGIHVSTDGAKATIDGCLDDNPSRRRDGLNVHFWCENCRSHPILSIVQHKGSTYIQFKTLRG